nr:MAG TPA: hypothetical protein [Caudoviricetes sp.]
MVCYSFNLSEQELTSTTLVIPSTCGTRQTI